MKLAMIVNPFTEHTLALAAQVGVEEIVLTYPGPGVAPLLVARRMVEAAGMRLAIGERKIPHLKMVHGLPGREAEVENFRTLLRDMAEAGLTVVCYNWMPSEDWQRTSATVRERGGSLVTEFNLADVGTNVTDADGAPPAQPRTSPRPGTTTVRSTCRRCFGRSRTWATPAACGPTMPCRWRVRPTRCSAASSPPATSAASCRRCDARARTSMWMTGFPQTRNHAGRKTAVFAVDKLSS